jgi:site-specific DNA recombinase
MSTTAIIYLRVSTKEQAQRGGEIEGFSIPAQREACARKAEAIGATVVTEFVDAGESARSADRPELQRMLRFLSDRPCDFVIVHKIDRLARNRVDDVEINVAIQKAGAKLVSVTENIDETPSGMLMHGIMSSIAEFYSRNLATETHKGMLQKAKNGGTPGMVPFGYLNVRRRTEDGREMRTVVLDPERAEHARWIFETYATGEWTMTQIRNELEERGVTSLPRPKRPPRPMSTGNVDVILRNRYYLGQVKFDGVWHPGRHEPLVSEETWERVKEVRESRVRSREKPQQHPHPLKGTVACGNCGELLGVEKVRNSRGTQYSYFFCLGRQKRRTNCDFRAVPMLLVEELVEDHWRTVAMRPDHVEFVRAEVLKHIDILVPERDRRVRVAERQLARLKDERDALLRAHYAGAVPLDQLRDEQDRIGSAMATAEREVSSRRLSRDQLEASLDGALSLLSNPHSQYKRSTGPERRQMNQAVYRRLYICDDEVSDVERTDLYERLLASDLEDQLRAERGQAIRGGAGRAPADEGSAKRKNLQPELQVVGSNFPTLVAGTGFEPATSGL